MRMRLSRNTVIDDTLIEGTVCGTSASSPIVAGTAALILGHEPGLTPLQLQNRIYGTAKPAAIPYEWGSGTEMGFVDAYDAVVEGFQ